MAVRRTREEKVKAQQRRAEMFSWQTPKVENSKSKKSSRVNKAKGILPADKFKNSDNSVDSSAETHYLRKDLLRTLLATVFVLSLLFLVYWLN